jgi:acyl-coenzyme A thioesterase PaaI-like protein
VTSEELAPTPPEILAGRERAAAALRRLGHAVVGHECDPALLEQVAVRADRIAAEVELGTPRSRPIGDIKRRLWEAPPPDGGPMSHFDECVVSGRANPMGIAVQVRRDGDEAVADVVLGPAFEGAPKRAHGGTVAAIFDDVMGYVLILHRTPAYTGRLTVHYRAPVPVGQELTIRARLTRRDGRKLTMASELSADGTLLAEGEALFIAIPPERLGISADTLPL